MKLKGINLIERHVEKIILIVVVLVFLGVLALQIVAPRTIDVGGQAVAPAEAFRPAEQAAQSLRAQLDSTDPALPDVASSSVLEEFEATVSARNAPRPEVLALGTGISPGVTGAAAEAGDVRYATLTIPAPSAPTPAGYQAAIDPREVIATPALAAVLPASQPFDVSAVSVQATFDGTALRDQLVRDDLASDGPIRAIPRNWWRGGIQILAVELERQKMNIDGSWGDPEAAPTPPGMLNLAESLSADRTVLGDIQSLVDRARENPRAIVQPAFYRTLNSAAWREPAVMANAEIEIGGVDPEIVRLEARRDDVIKRLDALREQLGGGGSGGRDPDRDRGRDPGGRRPGRDQPPTPPSGTPDRGDPQQRAIQGRIDRFEAELEELNEQLEALGVQVDDNANDPGRGGPDTPPGRQPGAQRGRDLEPALPALLENAELDVWAHDLSAEPDATYRYRLRVVVNNPFFGRRASLMADQQPLAASPTLTSDWSAWSDPIDVLGDRYYFMVNAAPADELRGVRATAELYRFYYGQWRRASVLVEPGDRLADIADLPELLVYDLQALRGDQPTDDDQDFGDPRGRDPRGVDPRDRRPPERDRGASVASDAELERAGSPGPEELVIETAAVLLDVALAPGSALGRNAVYDAILTDARSGLVRRSPASDRATEIYRRISTAARGAEQVAQSD